MRPKLGITLDRNLQQNKTTPLRNVKYRVILRINVALSTSEDKFRLYIFSDCKTCFSL